MRYNFTLRVLLLKNVKRANELRMKIERCLTEKKIDYYLNEIKVNRSKLTMINISLTNIPQHSGGRQNLKKMVI